MLGLMVRTQVTPLSALVRDFAITISRSLVSRLYTTSAPKIGKNTFPPGMELSPFSTGSSARGGFWRMRSVNVPPVLGLAAAPAAVGTISVAERQLIDSKAASAVERPRRHRR